MMAITASSSIRAKSGPAIQQNSMAGVKDRVAVQEWTTDQARRVPASAAGAGPFSGGGRFVGTVGRAAAFAVSQAARWRLPGSRRRGRGPGRVAPARADWA